MSIPATDTVSQQVIELASNQADIPKEEISLDSQFAADLGFDSLDQMEFVMSIEDKFNITVPDEEVEKIITIRDAVQAIQKSIS